MSDPKPSFLDWCLPRKYRGKKRTMDTPTDTMTREEAIRWTNHARTTDDRDGDGDEGDAIVSQPRKINVGGGGGSGGQKVMTKPALKPIAYMAGNDDFRAARNRCAEACRAFNQTPETAPADTRVAKWNEIVNPQSFLASTGLSARPSISTDSPGTSLSTTTVNGTHIITAAELYTNPSAVPSAPFVKPPIQLDYGLRVHIKPTSFINRGCYIMDTPVADIVIGDRVSIGPHVNIIGVDHPLRRIERREELTGKPGSHGLPVRINDGVWIGAQATILPGVTIGKDVVVGAGSVVTKNVPAGCCVTGNPARIICRIKDSKPSEYHAVAMTLQEALALSHPLQPDDLEDEDDDDDDVKGPPSTGRTMEDAETLVAKTVSDSTGQ